MASLGRPKASSERVVKERLSRAASAFVLAAAALFIPAVITAPASATPAAAISAGKGQHTCATTIGGAVKCWGRNAKGQLGDGTTTDRTTLVGVSGLSSGVVSISAGAQHACALITGGGVECWGANASGQLGDGTTTNSSTPVAVSGLSSGVIAISAGESHSCALTTEGGVKCWGLNNHGQLGNGTKTNSSVPVDVVGLSSGVAAISAGGQHTCSLTTESGARCWGMNNLGQLGNGTTTDSTTPVDVSGLSSGAAAISAGTYHTCGLTTGGGAKCWGYNYDGQLGDGTRTSSTTPVDVSGLSSDAAAITAGGWHTCAVAIGGAAKCWGNNYYGQLGDGTRTNRRVPVDVSGLSSEVSAISAGSGHTCALTTGGAAKCWGDNYYGQLGNGTKKRSPTPVQVSGLFPGEVARPDALISKGGPFFGGDIYNITGSSQTLGQLLYAGKTASFTVKIQNDGDATDSISVKGSAPVAGFQLTVTWDDTDVTTAFLSGALTVEVAPGAEADLSLRISIEPATLPGVVEKELVTITSANDVTMKDAVRAKVTVKG